jgi:hypothetical protein
MVIKEKLYRISFIFFLGISVLFTRTYSQDSIPFAEKRLPYIDSLFAASYALLPEADSVPSIKDNNLHIDLPDTVIFPTADLPLIFWGIDFSNLKMKIPPVIEGNTLYKQVFPEIKLFSDKNGKGKYYRLAMDYIVNNHPEFFDYSVMQIPDKVEKLEMMSPNIFQHLFTIDFDIDLAKSKEPKRNAPKRRYWTLHGNNTVKLSQNYLSDNWYKGGSGNLNLQNNHNVTYKYERGKIQFDNFTEWKLSLFNSPNDTLRNFRIGEDLIRTYSTLGLKAIKNWSYSITLEMRTQLFRNYQENTTQSVSAFMAPFMANMGILGMKYQYKKTYPKVKGKNLEFSADIMPLSVEYTFVADKELDPTRFGVEEGKRHKTIIGSTVTGNFKMYFNKNVYFTSRFRYFTNFEKAQVESENTLNMPINRYFSTTIYVYLRYDDTAGIKTDPKLGYFQLSEMLSFGFNYNW